MKIREIVSKNLITLRKRNNLTQGELAKKINFSDKAISRWEKGEVLPDLETLESVAKVYDVTLSYLIERHEEDIKTIDGKPTKNDIIIHIMSICGIWTILSILFVYLKTFDQYIFWQAFVWGVPLTCLYILIFTNKWKNKPLKLVIRTIMLWSTLAACYLQLLQFNLWLIFIIGVPIQVAIVVASFTNHNHNENDNID